MKFCSILAFDSIYTKSRKKLTAELHVLLKLQRRKREDWASKELVHEEPLFSIEAACSSWGSNSLHEQMVVRLMHRGNWQAGYSHSSWGKTNIKQCANFCLHPCPRLHPLSMSCFSIIVNRCYSGRRAIWVAGLFWVTIQNVLWMCVVWPK